MRHGEPELAGRLLGVTDCAVTEAGVAACVGQAANLHFERVVSSDLRRAADCAGAMARPVTIDPRWRELDFGAWDGLSSAEVAGGPLGAFWADPDAYPPPGGERWSALVARVTAAMDALEPRPTLVVTHGGPIRAALSALCGFGYDRLWCFEIPYAVVVSLTVAPGEPSTARIVGIRPCAV